MSLNLDIDYNSYHFTMNKYYIYKRRKSEYIGLSHALTKEKSFHLEYFGYIITRLSYINLEGLYLI